MLAFVNGTVLPEQEATISICDRAFRYGDGLFEAVLVVNNVPFRWDSHAARLAECAKLLEIPLTYPPESLREVALDLVRRNNLADAIVRIQISRGDGPRGYAPAGTENPVTVMTVHPAPDRNSPRHWSLTLSSLRVAAGDPLGRTKSCNRLLQVMAAIEARARKADESLILDTDGHITEGGSSNLFWIERSTICTPPANACGLCGVTRAVVRECCRNLGVATSERKIRPEELRQAEGVFLTLTSRGVVEATTLDGAVLSSSPLTARMQQELESVIRAECR